MADDAPMSTSERTLQPTALDLTEGVDEDFICDEARYNDKADLDRLQLPQLDTAPAPESGEEVPIDDRIARIQFHCTGCDMHEMVHYFGCSPPFMYGVCFTEDTYVVRDPFQPIPPRWKPIPEYFVALGAHCKRCQSAVCKDKECSFYYTHTYCLRCAQKDVRSFPTEVQAKLRKQLGAKA